MPKLSIAQYLDLREAGYTNAEIAEYNAGSAPDPDTPVQDMVDTPAPTAPVENNPQPTTEQHVTNPAPVENETQQLLRQMLGILQGQNINQREQPSIPTTDPAATMAAVLGPRPANK